MESAIEWRVAKARAEGNAKRENDELKMTIYE
jgi:hypothetical protein